jgi:hypothetical protein
MCSTSISAMCGGFTLLAHVEQTVTLTTFFDASSNPTGGLLTGPIFVTFTNSETGEREFFDPRPKLLRRRGQPHQWNRDLGHVYVRRWILGRGQHPVR